MLHQSNYIQDLILNTGLDYLIKPDISFGNYFLKWDEKSPGLYSNEIFKLKNFIKNMIPFLEPMMRIIDNSTPKKDPLRKVVCDKGQFAIADKYNSRITFILNMDINGSTSLFREERVLINNELFKKLQDYCDFKDLVLFTKLKDINNIISVKWKIGDLLFNRVDSHK